MAIKGTETKLLVDEFDFSGDTSGFSVGLTTSEEQCTTLASAAMEYTPILPSMTIEQSGYISAIDDTDELEAELYSRLGSGSSYVAALLGTSVDDCPAYVLDGTFGAAMNIQAPTTGLMTLTGTWGVARGGNRGVRIFEGTVDATGDEDAIDLGSAGSSGGVAYLFVQAIDGTATNASIKVQSATTEGGSYADEATFTVSDVGGYKVSLSGTVNRWLRLSTSSLGGATSLTVVCIVCVNRVTQ